MNIEDLILLNIRKSRSYNGSIQKHFLKGYNSSEISKLISRAKSRWYVPNPYRAADLEKLREKSLLKEFEEYKQFKGRKMKQFRLEAVRAGFKKAWQERAYQTIINIAEKIPEKVLQEDQKLLMWYDQAVTRAGD